MNKCVIATLVLLVATWQLTECEADGILGHFSKVTEKLGQKTVEIGQRVKEDAKVVKEKITTILIGKKDQKEHKKETKSDSEIPVVPPSQPETFPKVSPVEVTTEDPNHRNQIFGSPRCLPTQHLVAGHCHDQV